MASPELLEPTARDRRILEDLRTVRLLTGRQLERLHFAEIKTSTARGSARRRSLGRLVAAGLVTTLPRRVGGERAGSAGLVYALDARAQRWFAADESTAERHRIRRPWSIGWPFVQHTLDVAELYVRLREAERGGRIQLRQFAGEPVSWFPSGGGLLKPDAWAVFDDGRWERHVWLEVDRGTESAPTVARKLRVYVDFAVSGRPGPGGVVPKVLFTVPSPARLTIVRAVIDALPEPADRLIVPVLFDDAFSYARPPP